MPKLSYTFEENGPQRLGLSWQAGWSEFQVTLDGTWTSPVADKQALKEGQEIELPDGSILQVQLVESLWARELRVCRNGRPLPGSPAEPAQRVKQAACWLYWFGGLTAVVGLIVGLCGISGLQRLGLGYDAALGGSLFLILAYFVSRRSQVALGLAVSLLIVDTFLLFAVSVSGGRFPPIMALLVRVLILRTLFHGFGAIRTLKTSMA